MSSPPIRFRWPSMTPSFFVPERSPVTTLPQKLNQLSLTCMARQLDQTITDAAVKNRSFAESLESLVDCELESRDSRSIERRFRLSRLHARHSIDSFQFKHHKSRMDLKSRILRLLDLEFVTKGNGAIFIGNPGVGKTFLAKIIGWRACQANQRLLFTTAMDMLNHLLARAGRSLAGAQAQGLYRTDSLGLRRTGISVAGSANLESVLSGDLDTSQ